MLLIRSKLHYANSDYNESFRDIKMVLSLSDRNDLDVMNMHARSLNAVGRYDEASEVLRQVRGIDPDNSDAIATSANIYFTRNNAAEAVRLINDAASKSLKCSQIAYQKSVLFHMGGNSDMCFANVMYAIGICENDIHLDMEGMLTLKGSCLLDDRQCVLAEIDFRNAIQCNERYWPAYVGLAKSLICQSQWSAAERFVESFRRASQDCDESLFAFGLVSLYRGRTAEAARYFEKTKEASPSFAHSRLYLGLANQMLNRDVDARNCFELSAREPRLTMYSKYRLALLLVSGDLNLTTDERLAALSELSVEKARGVGAFELECLRVARKIADGDKTDIELDLLGLKERAESEQDNIAVSRLRAFANGEETRLIMPLPIPLP